MSPQRMGLPVDRLVIATNVNDILARTLATGIYDVREVVATSSPSMDIQVSSNFERLLFEAGGRDAAAVRAQMASLAQSGRFSLSVAGAVARSARCSTPIAPTRKKTAATIRTTLRETSRLVDPHTAVALAVAEKETRDPAMPMIVLGTAHPAKFPEAVEAACGVRPGLPDWLSDLPERPERATPMPVDQGGDGKIHIGGEPCRARRSRCMSVEVTRLPSGLTVVTDSMPHLQTASLGVWVGSGSRDEEPNEHGISHLLEHMAFKGTKRRTARQIAEEIEQVGGDLNAATSSETTAYFASVLKTDMPLAVDVLSDILANPTFDAAELKREQNVIVQEIGASEDNPDDLVFDYLQSTAFPNQPIGRPILGTRQTVCSFREQNLRAYLARNYRAPDMVVAATGAIEHGAVVAEVERRFGDFNGPAAPEPQPATLRWRHQA